MTVIDDMTVRDMTDTTMVLRGNTVTGIVLTDATTMQNIVPISAGASTATIATGLGMPKVPVIPSEDSTVPLIPALSTKTDAQSVLTAVGPETITTEGKPIPPSLNVPIGNSSDATIAPMPAAATTDFSAGIRRSTAAASAAPNNLQTDGGQPVAERILHSWH